MAIHRASPSAPLPPNAVAITIPENGPTLFLYADGNDIYVRREGETAWRGLSPLASVPRRSARPETS